MGNHPYHCRCGKVWAESKREAKLFRARIARRAQQHHKVRYYKCRYGAWHWTSELHRTEEFHRNIERGQ